VNVCRSKHIVFSLAIGSLLLLGLFLLLMLNAPPYTVYAWPVTPAVTPNPPGTRPPGPAFVKPGGTGGWCLQDDPCGSIQYAIDQCEPGNGDTIYVAGGTYTGTGGAVITLTKSITLYGGWDGTTTTPPVRDPDAYPTTLDGEGARRVVYIAGPVTVTLEGLTIANGKVISTTATGWDGAGLYARDAALTVRDTDFYSNVIDVYDAADSYAYGGGMMVEGGSLLVEASTFRWNSAWARTSAYGGGLSISGTLTATVTDTLFQDNDAWHAGGLYFLGDAGADPPFRLFNSTFADNGWGNSPGSAFGGYAGALRVVNAQAHIRGNVFAGNRASNDYGAVYVYDSELELTGNAITGTQCARTAGLYLHSVSPFTATNNIIADNHSTYYWLSNPAVNILFSSGRFLHNTIARNQNFGSDVGVAYGLLVDFHSTVSLTNTILVSHTVGISVTAGSTAMLEGTLWGSGAWANGVDWGGAGSIVTGTVNLWGDPAFVDPDGGDYHLGPASAAIDAGVDAGVTTDIDGDARPIGSGYDIGADEAPIWKCYLPLVLKNHS